MDGRGKTVTPEKDAFNSSKAEAGKFIENTNRLSEIAQARLIGMLEGGLTMWDLINAGNPQGEQKQ